MSPLPINLLLPIPISTIPIALNPGRLSATLVTLRLLHRGRYIVCRARVMLGQQVFRYALAQRDALALAHQIVVDLLADHRVEFVVRVRTDEFSHPEGSGFERA